MEAPERLYLSKNIYGTYLYQVPDPDDETAVEYIRKDAFIEKATKWLIDNIQNYTDDGMGEHSFVLVQDLKEDFKKYIEERIMEGKNQWKPNMAQLNALSAAIKQVDKGNADVLKGLYKKLVEL